MCIKILTFVKHDLPVHILHFRSKRWVLCSDVVSLSIQVRTSGTTFFWLFWLVLFLRGGAGTLFFCS